MKIIAKNKRASYDYQLLETYEAGLLLQGTEVKSLRAGKVVIADAFVNVDDKLEGWIHNLRIPHYEFGNRENHEEARKRKLLLNKAELHKLYHSVKAQAATIIATKIYFKGRHVKIEIALAKGKKLHDKRQDKAKKDIERKLQQGRYD